MEALSLKMIASNQSRPLLEAFGWAGIRHSEKPVSNIDAVKDAGPFTQTILAFCAILIPVSVCVYLSNLEPLFEVKSVEVIHSDVIVIVMLLFVAVRSLV